jgi:lysophospholipase L1-like esterase
MPDPAVPLSRRRRIMLRLVLLLLPILGLLALEAAARTYFWITHGVPGHSYGTSQYDPVMGAFPRARSYGTSVRLNNFAFRNTEDVIEPKPPGSLRVIAYGGSTVFCHHLSTDEAWPTRLQATLRAHRPGGQDQVMNGGVIMWSLGHVFERVRRDVPRLKPDAVIIYAGVNEMYNATYLAAEGIHMRDLVERGEYGRFTTNLAFATPFRNVITYKFVRDRVFVRMQVALRQPQGPQAPRRADPAVMENYMETLRRLVAFLREHGVRPIFVKEVFNPEGPGMDYNRGTTAYSAAAAGVVQEWGAAVVDPTATFADPVHATKGLFQSTGVHLTTAGADLMASVIFEQAFRSQ